MPRSAPSSDAPIPSLRARTRIEVQSVAEYYRARCVGNNANPVCDWAFEDDDRQGVVNQCVLHVAQTHHVVHIDTANIDAIVLREVTHED